MTEKEAKMLAMQSPSTQRAMLRSDKEQAEYLDSPLTKDWKAIHNAKSIDEAVGWRKFSYDEVRNYLGLQQNRGQYLAEMRKEAPVSSVDEAKRNRAIDAFVFIKQKFTDLMKQFGLASEKEVEMVKKNEK